MISTGGSGMIDSPIVVGDLPLRKTGGIISEPTTPVKVLEGDRFRV